MSIPSESFEIGDMNNLEVLAQLEKNWVYLRDIENQTIEMCLIAVKKDGHALAFVKDQTPEICFEAVKENPSAILYIKSHTLNGDSPDKLGWKEGDLKQLYLMAVSRAGLMLEYVDGDLQKEDLTEIQLTAVRQNGFALQYIQEQSTEICFTAVNQNALSLIFVNNQTPEVCLVAINQNESALKFVKDLNSIAHLISDNMVEAYSNSIDSEVVELSKILAKIREDNAIARRINNGLEGAQIKRAKVRL